MKKNWLQKKREREEELKKLQQEIAALKLNIMIEECPICMEKIEGSSSTTPCGHKFCTSCFVKSVIRKNSCPMCRAKIIDDNEYKINNNVNVTRMERLYTLDEQDMGENMVNTDINSDIGDIDIANYLLQLHDPFPFPFPIPFNNEEVISMNSLTFPRNVFDSEED